MAKIDSLRSHLVEELADALDAERQLTKALPKMAKAAQSSRLKAAFQSHLKETERHVERVKQALQQLGERASSKTCEGMEGLLEEGETMMNEAPAGALRDAVMITSAQKVEHYEIASYGTARTYAQLLGERTVARLLEQTLKEEKAADVKLTTIAEGSVNRRAAEEWAQEEPGMLESAGEWLGATAKQAANTLGVGADSSRARRSTRSAGRKAGGRARKRSSQKTARKSRKR